jgi:hypothetical protein
MNTQKRDYKLDIQKLRVTKYPYEKIVKYPKEYDNTTDDDVKAQYINQLIDKNIKKKSELTKKYRRSHLIVPAKKSQKKFDEEKKISDDKEKLKKFTNDLLEEVRNKFTEIYGEFKENLDDIDNEDSVLFILNDGYDDPYKINAKYFEDKMIEAGFESEEKAVVHSSIQIINHHSEVFHKRFMKIKDYLYSDNMTIEVLTVAQPDIISEFARWKEITEIIYIYTNKIKKSINSIDIQLRTYEAQFKNSYNIAIKEIIDKIDISIIITKIITEKGSMIISLADSVTLMANPTYKNYLRTQSSIVAKINDLIITFNIYYSSNLHNVDGQNITNLTEELNKKMREIIKLLNVLYKNYSTIIDNKIVEKVYIQSGGTLVKYKSTGQAVYILYKKRKCKKTIYVKEKKNTKYCKINNEYILLSKLNIIE